MPLYSKDTVIPSSRSSSSRPTSRQTSRPSVDSNVLVNNDNNEIGDDSENDDMDTVGSSVAPSECYGSRPESRVSQVSFAPQVLKDGEASSRPGTRDSIGSASFARASENSRASQQKTAPAIVPTKELKNRVMKRKARHNTGPSEFFTMQLSQTISKSSASEATTEQSQSLVNNNDEGCEDEKDEDAEGEEGEGAGAGKLLEEEEDKDDFRWLENFWAEANRRILAGAPKESGRFWDEFVERFTDMRRRLDGKIQSITNYLHNAERARALEMKKRERFVEVEALAEKMEKEDAQHAAQEANDLESFVNSLDNPPSPLAMSGNFDASSSVYVPQSPASSAQQPLPNAATVTMGPLPDGNIEEVMEDFMEDSRDLFSRYSHSLDRSTVMSTLFIQDISKRMSLVRHLQRKMLKLQNKNANLEKQLRGEKIRLEQRNHILQTLRSSLLKDYVMLKEKFHRLMTQGITERDQDVWLVDIAQWWTRLSALFEDSSVPSEQHNQSSSFTTISSSFMADASQPLLSSSAFPSELAISRIENLEKELADMREVMLVHKRAKEELQVQCDSLHSKYREREEKYRKEREKYLDSRREVTSLKFSDRALRVQLQNARLESSNVIDRLRADLIAARRDVNMLMDQSFVQMRIYVPARDETGQSSDEYVDMPQYVEVEVEEVEDEIEVVEEDAPSVVSNNVQSADAAVAPQTTPEPVMVAVTKVPLIPYLSTAQIRGETPLSSIREDIVSSRGSSVMLSADRFSDRSASGPGSVSGPRQGQGQGQGQGAVAPIQLECTSTTIVGTPKDSTTSDPAAVRLSSRSAGNVELPSAKDERTLEAMAMEPHAPAETKTEPAETVEDAQEDIQNVISEAVAEASQVPPVQTSATQHTRMFSKPLMMSDVENVPGSPSFALGSPAKAAIAAKPRKTTSVTVRKAHTQNAAVDTLELELDIEKMRYVQEEEMKASFRIVIEDQLRSDLMGELLKYQERDSAVENELKRLEKLERENTELMTEIRMLRDAIDSREVASMMETRFHNLQSKFEQSSGQLLISSSNSSPNPTGTPKTQTVYDRLYADALRLMSRFEKRKIDLLQVREESLLQTVKLDELSQNIISKLSDRIVAGMAIQSRSPLPPHVLNQQWPSEKKHQLPTLSFSQDVADRKSRQDTQRSMTGVLSFQQYLTNPRYPSMVSPELNVTPAPPGTYLHVADIPPAEQLIRQVISPIPVDLHNAKQEQIHSDDDISSLADPQFLVYGLSHIPRSVQKRFRNRPVEVHNQLLEMPVPTTKPEIIRAPSPPNPNAASDLRVVQKKPPADSAASHLVYYDAYPADMERDSENLVYKKQSHAVKKRCDDLTVSANIARFAEKPSHAPPHVSEPTGCSSAVAAPSPTHSYPSARSLQPAMPAMPTTPSPWTREIQQALSNNEPPAPEFRLRSMSSTDAILKLRNMEENQSTLPKLDPLPRSRNQSREELRILNAIRTNLAPKKMPQIEKQSSAAGKDPVPFSSKYHKVLDNLYMEDD
eukprot:ANDGO_06051.mRNA.1 hypothetical protein